MGEPSLIRPPTSLLCVALGSALLLSGLAVWTFVPAGSEDQAKAVEPPLPPIEIPSERGETSDPPPRTSPLTREWVRAWAERQDLPEARLAPVPDGLAPVNAIANSIGPITPKDAHETAIHRADQAHALGFDGTGVRVAVIDTGIDFAHPDLLNTTARVTDPASPYYLHPIAYDGASLNDYLLFGHPGPTSWYVNTSFSTTVFELLDGTRHVSRTDGGTTRTWNVTGVAGLDASEEVRLGFHPDDKLLALWGMRPGLILFNASGAGVPFDTVLVDLNADMSFVGEKPAWINTDWATFDAEAELVFRDVDADGVQDLSGGMLYFIADGVREIPYAARQVDVLTFTFQSMRNDNTFDLWADLGIDPLPHLVPGAGDLVLIFGDLDGPGTFGSHGTWVTSALVGQGITGGGSTGPVLKGMAPGAKIIGAGNNFGDTDPFLQLSLWTALVFATEGYDGVPGTGDEAHIASNSWGGDDWTGWDWGSRFADYVSTVMAEERTLFVFAAGNSGPGYGGRGGPAGGPSLLVAGAMENYNYRTDPWLPREGGPNPAWGETTWFSSRGPSALGRHYVDAQTSGEFGYGADPLNDNPFDDDSGLALNGSSSWVLWSGTSLATPNLSGVAALIYDAYLAAHAGTAPRASVAKAIVKNSADDAHQDPFMTGAGIANAHRGVLIANETDGLTTSLDEWYPGDYRGVVYPGYTQILLPGGADSVLISATNHRPSAPMTVDIEDAVLAQTGSLSMNFARVPLTPPDQFILNDTGILATDGSVLVGAPAGLFTFADAIRVTMFIDRSRMADVPPYLLRLFDWTDVNASGTFEGFDEENLMAQDWITFGVLNGPNGFAFVHDPANRTHDGLVIRVKPEFEFLAGPVDFTLQVDYFKRMDFPWLEVAPASLVIPAASSASVTLTVTVPGDADPGLYEAVVLFKLDNGNVTTLPVVVNVAASGLPMTFGGNTHDSGPYQQGVQYGKMWDDTDPIASGDFRYYFLDLPAAANVTVFLGWDHPASDHGLYVLSNVTDWFSESLPSRYGPGKEDTVAFTAESSKSSSIRAPMQAGLSIIVARSTFLAGISVEEHPIGQAGIITVTPFPWSAAGIPVDGSQTLTIASEIGFPDVTASVETGQLLVFTDQPVDVYPCTGACFGDAFVDYLFGAPNTLKTEISGGIARADYTLTFHSGARDVDMGIFYDNNCDGAYTVNDDVIGVVASTSANPELASVLAPAPGCYWVHAAGFDVDPGSLYDLTVNLITLPFITVASVPPSIDPGLPADVTVDYSLPHVPTTFGGTIFVGSSQFPRAIAIPLALTPDLPPLFSNETPSVDGTTNDASPTISVDMRDWPDPFETAVDTASVRIWLDGVDLTSFATVTPNSVTLPLQIVLKEGPHFVSVNATDLIGSSSSDSWSFTVDTSVPSLVVTSPDVAITNNPEVVIAGFTESTALLTVNGANVSVGSSGNFSTTLTLAEGIHSIDVVATDAAGNSHTVTVEIEVDTKPPALVLTSPADGATTLDASVAVSGTTEPGASVEVNGVGVEVASDGSFSLLVTLAEGENTITANATDAAGNTASASVTVTSSPVLFFVLAGVLGVVAVVAIVVLLLPWMARRAKRGESRFPRLPFLRKRER